MYARSGFVQLCGTRLHESTVTYHGDAIGEVADKAEIVADEDERTVKSRPEVEKQVSHLRTNGNVERGRRFVEDDQRRLDARSHAQARPARPTESW
ncbi:hypothetical protein [Natrinema pallidum]|uniref:Uncharacterized protein n=1 Tax=Natrinema pallidum TaxID=69527 RepID=A0A4P9TI07_9EURY|nr:hypothetical protein [Natrinema pallidum]QCW04561.1 hypothetical protein FGF80_15575 [Natrinema pallidum]